MEFMPARDAIVIGAGIIGASIGWRLAQQGLRVLLIDRDRVGGEASSAGAGMLSPGGEIEAHSAWSALAAEGLRLYPAFVAELEEEAGLHIDFQRLGAVELAVTHAEWTALQARAGRQAAMGIASCPLDPADLRKHVALARQDVWGALFYPQDALVDPRDLMTALRAACAARGVQIREGTPVTAIRPRSGEILIETGGQIIEAPVAVLAAGAWSTEIPVEGVTLPRAFPVRGHLLGYQLEPHSLGPLLRYGHTYVLQRANGFTVAGTSSEQVGFDRRLDPAILLDIHSRAADVFPVLADRQPAESWLGFRPALDSDRPAVGRAGDTALWLAYGHYRNGILMAPATAHHVAEGITANRETGRSAPRGTP
jgi:glycine oxidase